MATNTPMSFAGPNMREGWQELSGLSMFNIAKSITFGDVIRLAKVQEP